MIINVVMIIIGFILLIKGADFLVDGSSNIAKKLRIPEIIVGLTIVSIGTSMPELFVSVTSAIGGHSDMSIGNIIGSNVCNLLLILGLSAVIRSIKFQKQTKYIEIPMCILITVIFMILCNTGNKITKIESLLLIILFIIFILYTIFIGLKGSSSNKEEKISNKDIKNISILKNIIYIILGIVGLKFGGDFIVDNSVIIAEHFKISEKIISLTILAIGTSLPELVTSVTAAIKGNSDIAVGNILGSNIFNILLIVGVSSFINPISYNITYNIQLIILLISTMLLSVFSIIPPKNEVSRFNGIIYLVMYAVYLIILFII